MSLPLDSAIWRASMRLGSSGGERTGGLDRIASRGIVRMNNCEADGRPLTWEAALGIEPLK